jgi:eukaryotic-like serine/threonine-protein kinase
LLASGGMASVYLAEDMVLERKVALKAIHPHLANDKSFVDKFRREAKVAAKLSHPNLVNVFDQGSDAEVFFLVMEYVAGITLRDALNNFGQLDPARALEIIEPLTAALAAAHTAGILHRDLKPENVFLSDDGAVKLGDFGLARAISAHTQTGSVVGTVAYLSPELVRRGQADARSDIYSLGVMIFEMLTGTQPYVGDQAVQIAYQHANDRIPAPSSLNPKVPELLDEIVLWATAREPSHRPASAAALLPVIERARKDLGRGLTTRLQDLAQTQLFTEADSFAAPAGSTEVLEYPEANPYPAPDSASPVALKLERANRRSTILLAILTAIAVLGGSSAGWWFSVGPGGMSSIPELSGRSAAQATEALTGLGLEVKQQQENSGAIEIGSVIRTDPAAGSRVFKSTTVIIFVSTGPRQVTVPEATGLNLTQAQTLLIESGLQLGNVEYFFTSAEEDVVFAQSKPKGSNLDQDSVIDLSVSLGPLPSLEGLELTAALEELEGLDVNLTQLEEFSNQVPSGTVISLTAAKEPLPKGGKLTLRVSKGPEIISMPNVVGETIAAAKVLLENLGLIVVIDTNQLTSNFGIAKVRRQSPAAQTQVRVGDTVRIISR